MDPLSEVLSLLKLRSYAAGGFEIGGDWSVRFPPHQGVKLYAVVAGQCWFRVEGMAAPVRATAGDCFLLPRGRPVQVGSDLSLPPVDATAYMPSDPDGRIRVVNGGGDFFSIGGRFSLEGEQADVLLAMLPPLIRIQREEDKADLRWCLERMRQELREPQPGGFLIAQQLAALMLVQALRLHLAEEGAGGGVGWLFALADTRMRAAITAMHAEPARRWTLHDLARQAGMSRTSFAVRFKETAGVSPMDYLTRWRMLLAGDRLTSSREPVSAIALSLGYDSESAFSTAFKRVMGCSPRRYGRGRGEVSGSRDEEKTLQDERLDLAVG